MVRRWPFYGPDQLGHLHADHLPYRERLIISRLIQGDSRREIARLVGLTEERVTQIADELMR